MDKENLYEQIVIMSRRIGEDAVTKSKEEFMSMSDAEAQEYELGYVKKFLYMQLKEIEGANRTGEKVKPEDEFIKLGMSEILEYTFQYRDKADIYDEKTESDTYDIELPSMYLEGQDLSVVSISGFYPCLIDEENQKVSISDINLRDTGANIFLGGMIKDKKELRYNLSIFPCERDEEGNDVIDFENMDFRGCEIYGILLDENEEYESEVSKIFKGKKTIVKNKEGHLDEKYLERRERTHLGKEQKKVVDRAYKRILEEKSLSGMSGIKQYEIVLADYDLSSLNDEQIGILSEGLSNSDYNINISDAYFSEKVAEKLLKKGFKEVQILTSMARQGKIEFVKKYFGKLIYSYGKGAVLTVLAEQGETEFVKEHFWKLRELHYENQILEKMKIKQHKLKIKGELRDDEEKMLKDISNFIKIVEIDRLPENEKNVKLNNIIGKGRIDSNNIKLIIKNLSLLGKDKKQELIERIEENNENLKTFFENIDSLKEKVEVLTVIAGQGKTEFVREHYNELSYSDDKSKVLTAMAEQGEIEFVKECYDELSYSDDKSKVLTAMAGQGETEFVKEHFDELRYSSDKIPILTAMAKHGETEFVKECYDELRYPNDKSQVLIALTEQGEIEFVKEHYNELSYSDDKSKVLTAMAEQGEIEFVKEHYEELRDLDEKSQVVIAMKQKQHELESKAELNDDERKILNDIPQFIDNVEIDILPGNEKKVRLNNIIEEGRIDSNNIKLINKNLSLFEEDERQELIHKIARNKENLKTFFENIDSLKEKVEVLTVIAGQGETEFVKENFEILSNYYYANKYRSKILTSMAGQGEIKFVEEHFGELRFSQYKRPVLTALVGQGKIEFVEEHFGELSSDYKSPVLTALVGQGEIEFVKEHYEEVYDDLRGLEHKSPVLTALVGQGEIEFVKEHFGDSHDKSPVLIAMVEKGEIEFVKEHIGELKDSQSKTKVLISMVGQGEIEFVEEHYWNLNSTDDKIPIFTAMIQKQDELKNKVELNDDERKILNDISQFIDNAEIDILPEDEKKVKLSNIIEEGRIDSNNIKLISKNLSLLGKDKKQELIEKIGENNELLERLWDSIDFAVKKQLAFETKDETIIGKLVAEEKIKKEMQGKREVNCSGKMLYEELSKPSDKIDVDLVAKLIKAGSNVNYSSYTNERKGYRWNEITYKPVIMKALEIQDEEKRKTIIAEIIAGGLDIDRAKTKTIEFYHDKKESREYSALENEDFKKILEEKNNKPKKDITTFLKEEFGLEEEEIQKMSENDSFQNILKNGSIERLKQQKEIISTVVDEKKGLSGQAMILRFDPRVLYARLKFLDENKVKINSEKLVTTLGSSNKAFEKNFGTKLLGKEQNTRSHSTGLILELLKKYPMPRTKEELSKELSKIKEKYREREK